MQSYDEKGFEIRRRSTLEIWLEILRTIKYECKPTRIMYKSNISWMTLWNHIDKLEKLGLIEREKVKRRQLIYLTDEGKKVAQLWEEIRKHFPIDN